MGKKSKNIIEWDSDSDSPSTQAQAPKLRKLSSSSSSDDSDDDWTDGKTVQKNKRKVKQTKMPSSTAVEREHDEGRVSSDSEVDFSKFDDGLDENLIRDEADRIMLEQMTEKEREEELFKRLEKRELLKKRYEIELKLHNKKIREKKTRSAAAATSSNEAIDADELAGSSVLQKTSSSERSLARRQTVERNRDTNKLSALNDLLAKREQKKTHDLKRKETAAAFVDELQPQIPKKKKLDVSQIYSDDDSSSSSDLSSDDDGTPSTRHKQSAHQASTAAAAGGATANAAVAGRRAPSDDDWGDEDDDDDDSRVSRVDRAAHDAPLVDKRRKAGAQPISSVEELNKIRLSRDRMARWVHSPFFGKTVNNCFVRIGIGHKDGEAVYRVAEIIGVVETGKIYQISCTNPKLNTRTNKGLKLRHAHAERVYRLEFVSNRDFTEDEFQRWVQTMKDHRIALPTSELVEQKLEDINEARAYQYKETDIEQIVAEKNRFRRNPVNYAHQKAVLLKERDEAQLSGDSGRLDAVQDSLDDLERRAKELDDRRNSSVSLLDTINNRNRLANMRIGEEAFKEDPEADLPRADPFTRRQCKPTIITRARDPDTGAQQREKIKKRLEELYSLNVTNGLNGKQVTSTGAKVNASAVPVAAASTPTPAARRPTAPAGDSDVDASNVTVEQSSFDLAPTDVPKEPAGGGGLDLYHVHNFDIDINITIPDVPAKGTASVMYNGSGGSHAASSSSAAATNSIRAGAAPPSSSAASRRAINLDDYKRRKGLI